MCTLTHNICPITINYDLRDGRESFDMMVRRTSEQQHEIRVLTNTVRTLSSTVLEMKREHVQSRHSTNPHVNTQNKPLVAMVIIDIAPVLRVAMFMVAILVL